MSSIMSALNFLRLLLPVIAVFNTASAQTCGGVVSVTTTTGFIESLNYPSNYANNLRCTWTLTAPTGYDISYDFFEAYRLEGPSTCPYDSLRINDSPRYCGTLRPPGATGGNVVTVVFSTDFSITYSGFRMCFRAVLPGDPGVPTNCIELTTTAPITTVPPTTPPDVHCVIEYRTTRGSLRPDNSPFFKLTLVGTVDSADPIDLSTGELERGRRTLEVDIPDFGDILFAAVSVQHDRANERTWLKDLTVSCGEGELCTFDVPRVFVGLNDTQILPATCTSG